jgi:tetratricopeptide (TPR) repeat protein
MLSPCFLKVILPGIALLLLSGCSIFRKDRVTEVPPAGPAEDRQVVSMADQRLLDIYNRQQEIMTLYAENPDNYSQSTMEMRVGQVVSSYQAYLSDNPEDVEAYILFGKFLVSVGQWEMAIRQFLLADQINPALPVVKQQIGNYLAETGRYMAALPYLINAIDLAPEEGIYSYQLGWLLYEYRNQFIEDGFYDRATLEEEMLDALKNAAERSPETLEFHQTYAEAFYIVENPDWSAALEAWGRLLPRVEDPRERQTIQLHRAKILGLLGEQEKALSVVTSVSEPSLLQTKSQILKELQNPND